MSIKEIVLDMPAKRLLMSVILLLIGFAWVVQSLAINRVFTFISHGVSYFERIATDEAKEMANDRRESDEFNQFTHMLYDYQAVGLGENVYASNQSTGCYDVKCIHVIERMKSIAYVKNNPHTLKYIDSQIEKHQKRIDELVGRHEFNPELCHKDGQ